MSIAFSHCLLTIEAEYHPQTPARVLDWITRHNVLPAWFSIRILRMGSIRIVVELDCFDMDEVELIAKRIANIPSVITVSCVLMNKRTPVVP